MASNDDGMASLSLDETWYYYQNPTSGNVSTTPLTLRQLCRLFVPVREGMKAILPPNTRCLTVTKEQTFGEWKLASESDVLREASAQWFINNGAGSSDSEGPFSCRKISEIYGKSQSTLVYSQDITAQWTPVTKVTNLRLVLRALEGPSNSNNNSSGGQVQQQQATEAQDQPGKAPQEANSQEVQDELEAFLSSTADSVGHGNHDNIINEENEYESDGGTKYVKDPLTGNWIHEALAPPPETSMQSKKTPTMTVQKSQSKANKKAKKSKFSKRNAKQWIYVTGLPTDKTVTIEDVQKFFSKAGMLDLDPETLKPKIKLYQTPSGELKGDASICYANAVSVQLALQILDESPWDSNHIIRVQQAKFEAKEGADNSNGGIKRRRPVSEAKRKVARLALLQAQDEGFGERLSGGRKGLRIIVVKQMMDGIPENRLEDEIHAYCQEHGQVEKITCIEKSKVVIIKFTEPAAASKAVEAWHGKLNERTKQKMEAVYWDGVTDYTHKEDDGEEEKRHDAFGDWLESQQELPPELQLNVAND